MLLRQIRQAAAAALGSLVPKSQRQTAALGLLSPCLTQALSPNETHGLLMAATSLVSNLFTVDQPGLLQCIDDLSRLSSVQAVAVLRFQCLQLQRITGINAAGPSAQAMSPSQPGADLQSRVTSLATQNQRSSGTETAAGSTDIEASLSGWNDLSETQKTTTLSRIGRKVAAVSVKQMTPRAFR